MFYAHLTTIFELSSVLQALNSKHITSCHQFFFEMHQGAGPFTNYVDKLSAFFDFLSLSVDSFYIIRVDYLYPYYPPPLVYAVCERPQGISTQRPSHSKTFRKVS